MKNKVQAEIYRQVDIKGFPSPITLRFWQTKSKVFRGFFTFVEAFVEKEKERMYIQLDGNSRRVISPFIIKKLEGGDPNFTQFFILTIRVLEVLIDGWNSRKLTPRYQIFGRDKDKDKDKKIQRSFLDDSLDYISYRLTKIRQTGDVEEGAEALLRTEKGQEMLKEGPVSDRLKDEMKKLEEHVRQDDETLLVRARKQGLRVPADLEADYTEEDLKK